MKWEDSYFKQLYKMRGVFSLKGLIMWKIVKEREVNETEALQIHMSPAVTLRSIFRRESLQNNQNKSTTQHTSGILMFESKDVDACVHFLNVSCFIRLDFLVSLCMCFNS